MKQVPSSEGNSHEITPSTLKKSKCICLCVTAHTKILPCCDTQVHLLCIINPSLLEIAPLEFWSISFCREIYKRKLTVDDL